MVMPMDLLEVKVWTTQMVMPTDLQEELWSNNLEKPLHLVSWNTLSGNTRYTNGTFFRGALILKNVLISKLSEETICSNGTFVSSKPGC